MKRRILAVVLVLAMMLTLTPMAFAATPVDDKAILTVTPSVTELSADSGTATVVWTLTLTPPANGHVGAFQATLDASGSDVLASDFGDAKDSTTGYWMNEAELFYMNNAMYRNGIFSTFAYTPASGYLGISGTNSTRNMTQEAVIMTIPMTVDTSVVGSHELKLSSTKATEYISTNIVTLDIDVTPVQVVKTLDSVAVTDLTAPVKGGTPDTTATLTAGLTAGTVTWEPSASKFGPLTSYTATIPYTVADGYKLASGTTVAKPAGADSADIDLTNSKITVVYPATAGADPLGGTVTIDGTAKYGETLTAVTSALDYGTETAGTLSYQWNRDGEAITGATGATYKIESVDDIGAKITVEVKASSNTGSVTSAATAAVEKADGPSTAPAAPTVKAATDTTITVNAISGADFAISTKADGTDLGAWQSSAEFTGLTKDTTYYVYARTAATDTVKAGTENSVSAAIKTLDVPEVADFDFSLDAATYSAAAQALTVTSKTGVETGAITVKYNGAANAPTNAGTYAITIDVAGGATHVAKTGIALGNWTIGAKEVTITPDAGLTKVFGAEDPALTYKTDLTGDLAADFAAAAAGKTLLKRAAGENVAEYAITLVDNAKVNDNYALKLASAAVNFSITKATWTGDKTAATTVKSDTAASALTYTLPTLAEGMSYGAAAIKTNTDGLLTGTPSVTGTTLTYAVTGNDNDNHTGTIEVAINGGTNYNDATFTLTVTAKDIEFKVNNEAAAAANAVKIKDAPTYGDTWDQIVTILDSSIEASVAGVPVTGGTYKLDVTGSPDAGNRDYKVLFTGGAYTDVTVLSGTVDVAPKALTAADFTVGGDKTKVYDRDAYLENGDITLTVKASALEPGDAVDVTITDAAYDSAYVTATKIEINAFTLSDANYTLATDFDYAALTTAATITPKALSNIDASAVTVTKVYDGTLNPGKSSGSITYTGAASGDSNYLTITVADVSNYSDKNVGTGKTVTLTLRLEGYPDYVQNYSLTNNTVDIDKAEITPCTTVTDQTVVEQIVVKGIGTFAEPTFGGVNGETATGTVTYTYNNTAKSYDEIVADLKTKDVNATAAIGYSFAGTDNYLGASESGTIEVTVKDIVFNVGDAPATADNGVTIKADPTYGDTWDQIVTIKNNIKASVPTIGDVAGVYSLEQAGTSPDAGTKSFAVKFSSNDGRYVNVTVFTGNVEVAKKAVVVTPDYNQKKVFDTADSALTYKTNLAGDLAAKFEAAKTGALAREAGEDVGNYAINMGTLAAGGNFELALATTPVTFGITPKTVTLASATAADRAYNGSNAVDITAVTFNEAGKVPVLGTDFTVTGYMADANASDAAKNVTVVVAMSATCKNYTLASNSIATTVTISKATLDYEVKLVPPTDYYYNGKADYSVYAEVTGLAPADIGKSSVVLITYDADTTDDVAATTDKPVNAGTYTVAAKLGDGYDKNYVLGTKSGISEYTINKATVAAADYTKYVKAGDAEAQTVTAADFGISLPGTFAVGAATDSDAIIDGSVAADLTFKLKAEAAADKTATVALTFTPDNTNYEAAAVNLIIKVTAKDVPTANAKDITVTYTGSAVGDSAITGTASVEGVWSFVGTPNLTDANTGINVDVKFTPAVDTYEAVTDTILVTINPAKPAGSEPTYDKVTAAGKTLADVALTNNYKQLDGETELTGTFQWVDEDGITPLPDATVLQANKAYKWTFTPSDANYAAVTGTAKPYTVYSGGGGGGGPAKLSVTLPASTAGGSVTATPDQAIAGTEIVLTVKAEEGFKLDVLTVVDSKGNAVPVTDLGNGKYSFKMPATAPVVKVSFTRGDAPAALPFTDVKAGDWFYDSVEYVYLNGMMNGTSADKFSPDLTTTRGMIVTILHRMAGEPAAEKAMTFTDVPANMYYAKAIAWAAEKGIVTGYDAETFGPDNTITREQLAAILFRYAQQNGLEAVTLAEYLGGFADSDDVDSYAYSALNWAVGSGIITGFTDNTLRPDEGATRAQVATMLARFADILENLNK